MNARNHQEYLSRSENCTAISKIQHGLRAVLKDNHLVAFCLKIWKLGLPSLDLFDLTLSLKLVFWRLPWQGTSIRGASFQFCRSSVLTNFASARVFSSDFKFLVKMVTGLIVEDKFDGATNFRSWKTMILFILDENGIQDYVKTCLRTRKCRGESQAQEE